MSLFLMLMSLHQSFYEGCYFEMVNGFNFGLEVLVLFLVRLYN